MFALAEQVIDEASFRALLLFQLKLHSSKNVFAALTARHV